MTRLALGVIGAGYMGSRHAAKVRALAAAGGPVQLVAVHDLVHANAEGLARRLGVAAEPDCAALLRECAAVIVAVPVAAHHAVVARALAAGCDVLVEKPIAADLDEAHDLLARAARGGRVLQVGHLDWFNPATRVLRESLREPQWVEARREGPFVDRAAGIDVVRDLMIHDIDILQRLLGGPPREIAASGRRVRSREIDAADARLVFDGGCIAHLAASRIATRPERHMELHAAGGRWSVDFLTQAARWRPGAGERAAWQNAPAVPAAPEDALAAQLRAFVAEVARRRDPLGSARAATGALATAHRVLDAVRSSGEARPRDAALAGGAGPAR